MFPEMLAPRCAKVIFGLRTDTGLSFLRGDEGPPALITLVWVTLTSARVTGARSKASAAED